MDYKINWNRLPIFPPKVANVPEQMVQMNKNESLMHNLGVTAQALQVCAEVLVEIRDQLHTMNVQNFKISPQRAEGDPDG